ncbi:unnamed protein product [Pylaiella littoralis]
MNVLRGAKNYVTGALGFSSGETSGALDIMVVQQEDGVMSCTPFHVRFSDVHTTRSRERVIRLRVNGRIVPLCMKLGAAGEAFFVERVHSPLRKDLATSPLSSPLRGGQEGQEAGAGGGRQWEDSTGQDDWESRKPKSGRRKHHARRARSRGGTSEAGDSSLAAAASGEGGARLSRASTEASMVGTPWPLWTAAESATTEAAAAVGEGTGLLRATSLQDNLDGGAGTGNVEPSPRPVAAVAWAVGEGVDDSSCSSGAEGRATDRDGDVREGALPDTDAVPQDAEGGDAGPSLPLASPVVERGGGDLLLSSPSPPPGAGASAACGRPDHSSDGRFEPLSTPFALAGVGGRCGPEGTPSMPGMGSLSPPSSQPSSAAAAAACGGLGGAGGEADATGFAVANDAALSLGNKSAADATAGIFKTGAACAEETSTASASPWIGRGGSDDGNNEGASTVATPVAVVSVPPPPPPLPQVLVGLNDGIDSSDSGPAMTACVTGVVVGAEEVVEAEKDEAFRRGRRPPSDGPPVEAASGKVAAPSAATSAASALDNVVSAGESPAAAAGGSHPAEEGGTRSIDQQKLVPPDSDGTSACAVPTDEGRGAVAAALGESDHLALAHLLLRGREHSSCLPTFRELEAEGVSSIDGAEAVVPLLPAAAAAGTAGAADPMMPPQQQQQQLQQQPAHVDAVHPPSEHCVFPGGEDFEMKEEIIAVETLSPDAEAWATSGPPADDGVVGGMEEAARCSIAVPAPGLALGESPSRSASNTDLKGFHTPHGGSAADLTKLSFATDCDSAGKGLDYPLAAAAAAAAAGGAGSSVIPPRTSASPVMSLSGNLIGPEMRRGEGGVEAQKWARYAFMKEAVTWEDFSRYPQEIIKDPRLLVATEGRLMNVSEALPHLIAASVFGHSLLEPSLAREGAPKGGSLTEATAASGGGDGSGCGGSTLSGGGSGGGNGDGDGDGCSSPRASGVAAGDDVVVDSRLATRSGHGGREAFPAGVSASGSGSGSRGVGSAVGTEETEEAEEAAGGYWGLSGWFSRRSGMSPPPPLEEGPAAAAAAAAAGVVIDQRRGTSSGAAMAGRGGGRSGDDAPTSAAAAAAAGVKGGAVGRRGSRGRGRTAPSPLSMEVVAPGGRRGGGDAGGGLDDDASESDEDEDLYGKTLRPTSEQLAALRLRAGCNTVEFIVNVAGQAERVVSARAFLWGSGAKVVVSDIENTIARSGGGKGLGSFSQVVGPGVHRDVSTLYSKISANGYKILYLTNRPLPDWHAKRGMAEGGVALPRGPVLCPPEVLFRSTSSQDRRGHQEVFKMTALRGLKLIFPADVNPLYAGFGNSVSDMVAYKKMTVPEGRIFLINSMGELHNINHTYRQTYLSLSRHVDLTFPPLPHDGADDGFDGDDGDDYYYHDDDDDDDDDDADDADAAGDDESIGREGHHRGLMDGSGYNSSYSGAKSRGVPGLMSLESAPLLLSSSFATSGGGSGSGSVSGGGGGGGSGSGGANSADGNGGATQLTGVADASSTSGGITENAKKVRALGDESGSGSGSGSGVTTHPAAVKTAPTAVAAVAAVAAIAKTASKTTASVRRRWEEVAPRREKSFYPNRAAVEDRFTDLNFWRDPPPLIGDDDDARGRAGHQKGQADRAALAFDSGSVGEWTSAMDGPKGGSEGNDRFSPSPPAPSSAPDQTEPEPEPERKTCYLSSRVVGWTLQTKHVYLPRVVLSYETEWSYKYRDW